MTYCDTFNNLMTNMAGYIEYTMYNIQHRAMNLDKHDIIPIY